MRKVIILDRDGVINYDSKDYIKSPAEWRPYPDSLEAIKLLKEAGWLIFVATNQSGIGRGFYTEATLSDIHEKMHSAVRDAGGEIDDILFCPHLPDAGCHCRKPKPGLLEKIAAKHTLSLQAVPFVGDSWRDLEAGITAGCEPILVKTGNGQQTTVKYQDKLQNIKVYDSLLDATHRYFLT